MTARKLKTPRDPLARRKEQHVPPAMRSSALHSLSVRASIGAFQLQICTDCKAVTYPPLDACPKCWAELEWSDQPNGAVLLAETQIEATTDLYFKDHLPWRIGSLKLDVGPVAIAHLHKDLQVGERAALRLMLDKGGNAALYAFPADRSGDMSCRQFQQFTVPVKDQTILVTDARSAMGRAVVKALHAAGARLVVAGLAPPQRASDATDPLFQLDGVQVVQLDITDGISLSETLTNIGGPLDMVVNTATYQRRAGVSHGSNLVEQRHMLESIVMGFSRLAAACGPILAGRPAPAFVDIISAHALAPDRDFAAFSAAQAAKLSLLNSFRTEMRACGVRVLTIMAGPTEDEDHQSVPPPKVAPNRIAAAVLNALENGRETSLVGDYALDAYQRWASDPALYVREKNL
jgi:NAD(P)-dependent dehydrogenase (short-subunit alcohol dehydrogenase family)/uncharacterized OB-fold protein